MKRLISAAMALCLLLCMCACSGAGAETDAPTREPTAAPAGNAETVTVTDHAGQSVTVPRDIGRIAVCDILPLPSVLAVFFDSAEKLVGIAPSSMTAAQNSLLSELYPELLNAETGFMSGSDVNTEELARLAPDVVFYNASNAALGENLRRAGFAAIAVSVNKWEYNAIETLNNWIALLSELFPDNDRAEICKRYSDETYALVQERTASLTDEERERVFFLFQYSDSAMMTSGRLFFGNWWASAVGAVNVAEELTQDNSVAVNLEQVYEWNPGMIFMTNFTTAQPQDIYDNTVGTYDWSGVRAVQDGKVYKMPLGMYRSYTPGVDTPITLLWLAKTVYPDLFEDIDITGSTIDYYETVFGVTLTAEQAQSIFAPTSAAGKTDF